MEIRRRTLEGIQIIKGKDYKSTYTHSTQKRRKSRVETNISGHAIGGFYLGSKKENENQSHFYQE